MILSVHTPSYRKSDYRVKNTLLPLIFISFVLTVRMFMGDRHRVSPFCQRHVDNHRPSTSRLLVLTFARFLVETFTSSQNPLRIWLIITIKYIPPSSEPLRFHSKTSVRDTT